MTDTPSDAAKRKRNELVKQQWHSDRTFVDATEIAFALHLDEVDRVALKVINSTQLIRGGHAEKALRSLMLPDPPDSDEELSLKVAMHVADDGKTALGNAADAALATIKRLRADGRLTDAK